MSLLREKQHKITFLLDFLFFDLHVSCTHASICLQTGAIPLKSAGLCWCSKESMHMPGSSWYLQKVPFELAFDYTPVSEGGQWDSLWLVSMRERWWKVAKITFNITGLFKLPRTALHWVFLVEREYKLWCRTLKDLENITFVHMVWVLLSHLFILLDICRIIWSMSWNPSLFLPTTNQTINRPIKSWDLERGEEGK